MKFLIVGLGSVGKRHKKNLERLRHKVFVCHHNENPAKKIDQINPEAVVITSPTAFHLPQALIAARKKKHIFVEKPLSHNLKEVNTLLKLCQKNKTILQVGYQMRFHPKLINLKKSIDSGKIGKIYGARIEAGQNLADWHPGIDYSKSYSALKKLGGGVVLDLSHEIDYACWFFGKIKKVKAIVKKISDLKIETEDLAEILLEFDSGVVCSIHLDYLQRSYRRTCQLIGSKGNLYWKDKQKIDRNLPYLAEMKNFIRSIQGKGKPVVDGKQAREVLKVALKIKENLC